MCDLDDEIAAALWAPEFLRRMRAPSSTPAGMSTLIAFSTPHFAAAPDR